MFLYFFCCAQPYYINFAFTAVSYLWPFNAYLLNLVPVLGEALSVGLYITFIWSLLSYEVVKMYPPMRDRYLWILKTSVKLHPELYSSCEGGP